MINVVWPYPLLRRMFIALVLTSVEAFVALACFLSGLPILIAPATLAPNSALLLLPGWSIYPWGVGLVVGGGLSLGGIALSQFRIERAGVLMLMTTVGIYSFALIAALPNSFFAVIIFSLFSIAMFARYWVLGKLVVIEQLRMKELKAQLKEED